VDRKAVGWPQNFADAEAAAFEADLAIRVYLADDIVGTVVNLRRFGFCRICIDVGTIFYPNH